VTRVEHARNPLAFLLQSPEPLDWKRTALQLQRTNRSAPPPLVPREVKFTHVTFGTMQPNDESVRLLLREATDLTGYRIEYAQFPGPVAEASGDPVLFTDAFLGAPTTPTEAATILWQPSLTDMSEVDIVDAEGAVEGPSHWSATGGVLTQSSTIRLPDTTPLLPGTYAVGGNSSWVDSEIAVRLYLVDNASIGLMFRYQDPDNYYYLSIDTGHGSLSLLRLVGGSVTVLWRDESTYDAQQSYVLTLRVVGSEIHGSLDGHALFTVHDGDLTHGRIGFACRNDQEARFDQVVVTDRTQQLGRWALYDRGTEGGPSAWQMGGGVLTQRSSIGGGTAPASPGTYAVAGDAAWTDYRVGMRARSDDTGSIGLMFRYQDSDNYYRFSVDAGDGSQRLIKNERGTVTVLWEGSAATGIAVGEPFTLTVEALGSSLVGYINDTRLFDRSDATHPSGRIGVYCQANTGARFEQVTVRRPSLDAYALLRDRFAEDDTSDWSFRDEGTLEAPSQWAPVDGVLRQTSTIHSFPDDPATLENLGTQAVTGDPAWTDTILSVRLQSQARVIGVMFRYQDEKTYYRFSMDEWRGYRRLVKKVDGTFTLLWEDAVGYESGQPYDLTLVAVGRMLRGYMDGVPLFAVEDGDISSGQIGLYCWNNSDARFAQVRVYPASLLFSNWLLQEWFPVFRPNFWTIRDEGDQQRPSQWEVPDAGGELRQVSAIYGGSTDPSEPSKPGTYALAGDPTWTDYRVQVQLWSSDENGAFGVMFRYLDAQHYYQFSMSRALQYRRLVKNVAGAVSVLWEDDVQYTLDQRYMLTLECSGNELAGYLNGVQLFTVVDDDLSTGQIGLYCWRNTSAHFANVQVAAPVWVPYYAFEQEERLPAGTQVHVYAGSSTIHPPPQEPSTLQRFVSTLDETGQLHFLANGADLRLVAPGGKIGHERRFLPDATYEAPLDIRVLRKADGTGCFIFQAGGAAFETGIYRLSMTYRRDNRAADHNSQVLREAGESTPEAVQIDISWQAHGNV
jgi:hypothetical protein